MGKFELFVVVVCNFVAAALYRIEAIVHGLANRAYTSKSNKWLPVNKDLLIFQEKSKI